MFGDMSAAAVLQVATETALNEVREKVYSLWDKVLGHAYESEVSSAPSGLLTVDLSWFFGDPRENRQATQIAEHLLSISKEGAIRYFQDPTFDPSDPDFPRPLSVQEIFQPEFKPRMDAPIHYRYTIRR
jgi:hypothetical protein